MARFGARFGLTRFEADEYYKLALNSFEKQDLDNAILEMTQAIELLPNNAEYYSARGYFYVEHDVADKAHADFDQALKLNKYEMLANYGKGMLAYKSKGWEESRAYFMTAWATNPDRAETLYYLGIVEHRLKNNLKAKDWMQQALIKYEEKKDRNQIRNAKKWISEFDKLIQRNLLV